MILKLALADEPILRKKTEEVLLFDEELSHFVSNLVETMVSYNGWGLAAPQVFSPKRLFAMSVTDDEEDPLQRLKVFINPELIAASKHGTVEEEACLSLPGLNIPVWRPHRIEVKGQDLNGNFFSCILRGMEARCFLHEYDHLYGVLISDYKE